jgi:hypothetical protein
MSCETSVNSGNSTLSERVKHYDSNTIDTNSSEDCCGIECCAVGCTCIINACSSFAYVSTEVNSIKIAAVSETIYRQQSEQPMSISTMLYRPPIFSS